MRGRATPFHSVPPIARIHAMWDGLESVERPSSAALRAVKRFFIRAMAIISVVQTGVKPPRPAQAEKTFHQSTALP